MPYQWVIDFEASDDVWMLRLSPELDYLYRLSLRTRCENEGRTMFSARRIGWKFCLKLAHRVHSQLNYSNVITKLAASLDIGQSPSTRFPCALSKKSSPESSLEPTPPSSPIDPSHCCNFIVGTGIAGHRWHVHIVKINIFGSRQRLETLCSYRWHYPGPPGSRKHPRARNDLCILEYRKFFCVRNRVWDMIQTEARAVGMKLTWNGSILY